MGYNPWVKTDSEARWEWLETLGFICGGLAIMVWLAGY